MEPKQTRILPAAFDWTILLLGAPLLLLGGPLLCSLILLTIPIIVDFGLTWDRFAQVLLLSPQLWSTLIGLGLVGAGAYRLLTRRSRIARADLRNLRTRATDFS